MSRELKVMTFNLRMRNKNDGINYFDNRHERVLGAIAAELPDLIGFQEATGTMRRWLAANLPAIGYTVLGCGRGAAYDDESTSIAFRTDLFDLVSFDTQWLSNTPLVPGSRYGGDQSQCPRTFSAAVLKPLDEPPFLFVNTHLDHVGNMAKLLGMTQIIQYVSMKNLPVIITGDANARPQDAAITAMVGAAPCGRPIVDLTETVDGTFHNFGKYPPERQSKIDYIFTDMPCDPTRSYKVADEGVDGVYISDHFVVCGFVTVGTESEA